MAQKNRSLSKLFEKQNAASPDDLSDDDEASLVSESKASIAGHLRSMLTRSASRMSMSKDSGPDMDDISIVSSSEGSVLSARSVLSRTATGISSGFRRGSQLLRSSSWRNNASIHGTKSDKRRSSLYGSYQGSRDDSSNSSLESIITSGHLSRRDIHAPSVQPNEPQFDLTVMRALTANGKQNKGKHHIPPDMQSQASGSVFEIDSQRNNHSSVRSLELDQLGSSFPSIYSSRASTESVKSFDLGESYHSRRTSSRRQYRRRPRSDSVECVSSGTINSVDTAEQEQKSHMSVDRIDFQLAKESKASDMSSCLSSSASRISTKVAKNPRHRRTQRPKGFSSLKLHSSSGSVQSDLLNHKSSVDGRGSQNQKSTNGNPSESLCLKRLNTKRNDCEALKSSIRNRKRSESMDELRKPRRHNSSGSSSMIKATSTKPNQRTGVKSRTSNVPVESRKPVSLNLSFNEIPHNGVSQRKVRHGSDDGIAQNESWESDFDHDNTTKGTKIRHNLLLKKLDMKMNDCEGLESKGLNRKRSESMEEFRSARKHHASGHTCIKGSRATLSQDMSNSFTQMPNHGMLNSLGQRAGVKSRSSNVLVEPRRSVWRTVSFGERLPSVKPLNGSSQRKARHENGDGMVHKESRGPSLDYDSKASGTKIRQNNIRSNKLDTKSAACRGIEPNVRNRKRIESVDEPCSPKKHPSSGLEGTEGQCAALSQDTSSNFARSRGVKCRVSNSRKPVSRSASS